VLIEIDELAQDADKSSMDPSYTAGTPARVSGDLPANAQQQSSSAAIHNGGHTNRPLATPAVRRLARESGIDLASVVGTGPAGRVTTDDVRHAATAPALEPPEVSSAATDAELRQPVADAIGAEERIPLRGLRRVIAENMVRSASTIPQITSMVEVDASSLVALRNSIRDAAAARGTKLSYLPFILKALVQALRQYPYVNAMIDDATNEIVLKRHFHIGIATATPDGLLVPVVRHADRLTVLELGAEIDRLAEGGRARTLSRDELRGSTFTVSNFGSVGGFFATPIINPGEAGILGLGRIVNRPWVVGDHVEPRPVLPLSFTADHRLIDGELATQFLNVLITLLEAPSRIILEMR
jgi:pyruvate dehydrogenase E2 component (dihydrolipoamide acetyltransferase)